MAIARWRERIGIVLQDSSPEPELTVRECLSLYAGYYSAPRELDDTLAQVGLAELADHGGASNCPAASAAGSTSRWR